MLRSGFNLLCSNVVDVTTLDEVTVRLCGDFLLVRKTLSPLFRWDCSIIHGALSQWIYLFDWYIKTLEGYI